MCAKDKYIRAVRNNRVIIIYDFDIYACKGRPEKEMEAQFPPKKAQNVN